MNLYEVTLHGTDSIYLLASLGVVVVLGLAEFTLASS